MQVQIDKKLIIAIIAVITAFFGGKYVPDYNDKPVVNNYDPNDPIYKYIPPAEPSWIEKFGDSERTRLMHSISELRVVVSNQGKLLAKLTDPNGVDPNDVFEDRR